jgi:hypothetical protein
MLPEGDVISELDVPRVESDIYGLAWYTFSKIESKSGGSVSEALTDLNYLLGSLLEEDAGLAVVLYDKRMAIGMMLAYYILRKNGKLSKSRMDALFNGLLDIVGKCYSWYDYDGEVIFALHKLSEAFPEIEKKVHLQDLIKDSYSKYNQRLREYEARDSDIEGLLYLLWIRAASKESKDLPSEDLQTLLDNKYMRERVARNPMLMVLYAIVLSELINRINFFKRGKMFDKIKPILNETKTCLDKTASILSQAELLDIKGKLELAKYKLELTERALRTFSELKRQKRKDFAVSILSLISIIIIHHLMNINIPAVSDLIRQYVLHLDIIIVSWVLLEYYGRILGNKMRILLNIVRQILDKFAGSIGKSG